MVKTDSRQQQSYSIGICMPLWGTGQVGRYARFGGNSLTLGAQVLDAALESATQAPRPRAPFRHAIEHVALLALQKGAMLLAWRGDAPLNNHRRPGQSAAKTNESDIILVVNALLLDRFTQSDRYGRSRSIAVMLNIAHELVDIDAQLASGPPAKCGNLLDAESRDLFPQRQYPPVCWLVRCFH